MDEPSDSEPGVIYASRIPPGVTPQILRQILEQYGHVRRLYLAPQKGNRMGNPRFEEGWVEFVDKAVAKKTAQLLNRTEALTLKGRSLGGELWNLKYLPKFKWPQLTEKDMYEKTVRHEHLKAEISQGKRLAKFYLVQAAKRRSGTRPNQVPRVFSQRQPVNK